MLIWRPNYTFMNSADTIETVYKTEFRSLNSIQISKWNNIARLINRWWGNFLLDALYASWEGKILLTMAIYEAVRRWWKALELTAVANMSVISQSDLELFYESFGFKTYGTRSKGWYIDMRKNLEHLPLVPTQILEKIFQTHWITPWI